MKKRTIALEIAAAFTLTTAQIFMTLAVILLVLSSYEWWGSPNTPLAGLWKYSIVLYILNWILRLLHRWTLKNIVVNEPEAIPQLAAWSSMSHVSVPKLSLADDPEEEKEEKEEKQ